MARISTKQSGMEEAPENGKESSHSAHDTGLNELSSSTFNFDRKPKWQIAHYSVFMQGLIFVFICILIFKFYIVHNIASHDAIFCRQTGASRG